VQPDFTLVDLLSQYDAVQQYVYGWSPERMLRWFSRFGTVETLDLPSLDIETLVFTYPRLRPDGPCYAFIPPTIGHPVLLHGRPTPLRQFGRALGRLSPTQLCH
jgi:hypothetical protein